jgi:hypothetical protein
VTADHPDGEGPGKARTAMITAGAAELSRYQLYRRHRLNVGEVTCVNSVKTLSATGDYVNAENRGDRDQRELRQLVARVERGECGGREEPDDGAGCNSWCTSARRTWVDSVPWSATSAAA